MFPWGYMYPRLGTSGINYASSICCDSVGETLNVPTQTTEKLLEKSLLRKTPECCIVHADKIIVATLYEICQPKPSH